MFFDDVTEFFGDVSSTAQAGAGAVRSIQNLANGGGLSMPYPQAPAPVQGATKQFPWVLVGLGVGALLIFWAMKKS